MVLFNSDQVVSGESILALTRDLCKPATGVVSQGNDELFSRIGEELPLTLHRYASGSQQNGWVVPKRWRVERATISHNGTLLYDGASHTLAVAQLSKSFKGTVDFNELAAHVITDEKRPDAIIYHCAWQYRPWDIDWAFSIPFGEFSAFPTGGRFEIDLETITEDGEMLVGECFVAGTTPQTIVFNSHVCHPHQANDGMAGVALLIRLFQWINARAGNRYSYRLILAPEHLGTVFYLGDRTRDELELMVSGIFAEMPGVAAPLKITSSFLGDQPIDILFAYLFGACGEKTVSVPWRKGAGNDETVWEAPGYEVPFVELTRCIDQFEPYPEYHSSLDTAESLDSEYVERFYLILKQAVEILEKNRTYQRRFDGLPCLSHPDYNLYCERPDPAVNKGLPGDSEKWGGLLDSLMRYFNGRTSTLDIALRHDLSFHLLWDYLRKFEEKGLVTSEPAVIRRHPVVSRNENSLTQGR